MSWFGQRFKEIGDFFNYILLRGFLWILGKIPLSITTWVARLMGRLSYHILPRRRRMALEHLKIALGEKKSDSEIKKTLRKFFENIPIFIAELAHFAHWNEHEIRKKIRVEGLEHYRKVHGREKGILLVSAHFGNFLLLQDLSFWINPGIFVIRPIKNNRINQFFFKQLTRFGNRAVSRNGAFREIETALIGGKAIRVMADQRGGKEDNIALVSLFRRNFRINKAPAFLALKCGVPVLPVHIFREDTGQHRIEIGPEIPIHRTGDWEEDIARNLQTIISTLEKIILKAPDHWWYWAWRGFQKDFKGGNLR